MLKTEGTGGFRVDIEMYNIDGKIWIFKKKNIWYCYAIIIIKCTDSYLFKTDIMAPDGVQSST